MPDLPGSVGAPLLDIEERLSDLIDDREFRLLDSRFGQFNLFEAVGAVRGELRHSNFLAFLLSPNRSHGLGSLPLLRVLRAVLAGLPREDRPLRPLELVVGDLDGAIVYRERDNIDLLIEIAALRLVVLIENKIGARAGMGQLARYRTVVERRYPRPQWRHLLVFLTPDGTDPAEPGYTAFGYSELAQVIEALAEPERDSGTASTGLILRHYVEMLRRHVVPDEKLQELARQLYERHREALDFIFEARPETESLIGAVRPLLDTAPGLIHDRNTSVFLRFVPAAWADVPVLNACPAGLWTRTGRNLLFEIKTFRADPNQYSDRVSLVLVVGPAEARIREVLYEGAKRRPKVFSGLAKPMGKQWATIYSRDLLTTTAARDLDRDQKAAALATAWGQFLKDDLPSLTGAVLEILRDADLHGTETRS